MKSPLWERQLGAAMGPVLLQRFPYRASFANQLIVVDTRALQTIPSFLELISNHGQYSHSVLIRTMNDIYI